MRRSPSQRSKAGRGREASGKVCANSTLIASPFAKESPFTALSVTCDSNAERLERLGDELGDRRVHHPLRAPEVLVHPPERETAAVAGVDWCLGDSALPTAGDEQPTGNYEREASGESEHRGALRRVHGACRTRFRGIARPRLASSDVLRLTPTPFVTRLGADGSQSCARRSFSSAACAASSVIMFSATITAATRSTSLPVAPAATATERACSDM